MADAIKRQFKTVLFDANCKKLASSFDCGNTYINQFINSSYALDPGYGTTYVWLDDNNEIMIGFYNIAANCMTDSTSYRGEKIGGAMHINELAINLPFQKTKAPGLDLYTSDLLLTDCIERAEYIRNNYIGFMFITLFSTEAGRRLYERNQFEELEEDMQIPIKSDKEYDCVPMYLPLGLELYN